MIEILFLRKLFTIASISASDMLNFWLDFMARLTVLRCLAILKTRKTSFPFCHRRHQLQVKAGTHQQFFLDKCHWQWAYAHVYERQVFFDEFCQVLFPGVNELTSFLWEVFTVASYTITQRKTKKLLSSAMTVSHYKNKTAVRPEFLNFLDKVSLSTLADHLFLQYVNFFLNKSVLLFKS